MQLNAGPVVIAHLVGDDFNTGDEVQVFSHSDASRSVVLLAVPASANIETPELRQEIVAGIRLDKPAERQRGI